MRERSALGVLAGQADMEAFLQQRAERQCSAMAQSKPFAGLEHLAPASSRRWMVLCGCEVLRHRRDAAADVLQHVNRDAGIAAARLFVGKPMADQRPSSQSARLGMSLGAVNSWSS